MKWMIMVSLLLFFSLSASAQLFRHSSSYHPLALVATNGSRNHLYHSGRDVKVHYHHNGQIVKARGRLMINDVDSLELMPYGRKPVAFINPDSITAVSRWNRKSNVSLAVITGTGIVTLGLAAATLPAGSSALSDGNFLTLFLLLYAALDAYYVAIAAPIVFISEWLSIRSEKKGYHFSIE